MKIICDSCGTKYSISDDKVRGKVFKIRCKKCSHIIVVRGGEAAADAAAMTPPIEGGWHIVVDGEQVGPIPESDVRARIERGEIKADTYTWKEGFTDWVKLSAVPEFADLLATAAPVAGELFAAPVASNGAEHGHHPSAPRASLFGNGTGEDVFSAPASSARSSGGDLFAASTATAASEPRWPTSGAAASGHDGGRVESLTGQRHENSVLFSLANLQSLASANAPKPAPSVGLGSTAPEGSGLIDIRAMAASTLSSPADGANGGHAEDLPAFGSFSPAAPVLLPIQSSTPKWVYPAVGIMVALVGAIIFVGYKVATARSPLEPTQVLVPVPTPVPAEPAKPTRTAAAAPAAEGRPSTIPDDKLPPRADEPSGKTAESKSEKGEHHHSKVIREKKVASADEKKAASGPAPVETEKKPAKGTIDALLLDAVPKGSRSARGGDDDSPKKSAGEGAAPLAKNAVVAGMNSVKGKVNDCYNQFKVPGMAMVNVVIGKNGKISSATVTGKFAGTPTGTCVERAVKSASFPPSSDGLSTPYPFNLK